jgi:hypothetical protein
MTFRRFLAALLFGFLPSTGLLAQEFGNAWAEFQNEDSRIVADLDVGLEDTEEKDYAFGDFDKDGDIDLVVVRKQGWHTTGKRRNVLFMNEGGQLVDRSAEYASASDVLGDQGFLTPTNDRDVVITDVDGDTWPDIVTATTLSPGESKNISHPRVYLNLGEDEKGAWLGFRFESGRIPQLLLANGQPSWPRFTAVAAGDLTGDGLPELYFGDNDDAPGFGGGDLDDRLLINDGFGFFTDETTLRLTNAMVDVSYTTRVVIEDLNGDDLLDVLRNRGLGQQISVIYNDPDTPGFFTEEQVIDLGQPYNTSVGDLNRDDWPDLLVSHNSQDRYLYSQGVDEQDVTQWGPGIFFDFLTGSDDGFGADSYVVDLNGDGWNDAVITDVDPQVPGCGRRTHIYHNPGGVPGSSITLREEAEQQNGGWRGVVGLLPADLQSTHDAAIFDIDGDDDLDLVLGRCSGTNVWINVSLPPVVGGSVPDGSGDAPLRLVRLPNGSLRLFWSDSCAAGDFDYGVYSGPLTDLAALAPLQCSTSGATFVTITPPAGDAFFLVVPNNGIIEGSYGRNGENVERGVSQAACYAQALAGCS